MVWRVIFTETKDLSVQTSRFKIKMFQHKNYIRRLRKTLFTFNHYISFICLQEIMFQQVPLPIHFYLFPRKLLWRENTLPFYFPAEFSGEFTLSLYLPAND
jgi:hypothetical protein